MVHLVQAMKILYFLVALEKDWTKVMWRPQGKHSKIDHSNMIFWYFYHLQLLNFTWWAARRGSRSFLKANDGEEATEDTAGVEDGGWLLLYFAARHLM